MALDSSMRMGLVDISLMHILRKKKQSPKRTAKKILDTFHNIYPEAILPGEEDSSYADLVSYINENDFLSIRGLLHRLITSK